jgi:hypothetical protein
MRIDWNSWELTYTHWNWIRLTIFNVFQSISIIQWPENVTNSILFCWSRKEIKTQQIQFKICYHILLIDWKINIYEHKYFTDLFKSQSTGNNNHHKSDYDANFSSLCEINEGGSVSKKMLKLWESAIKCHFLPQADNLKIISWWHPLALIPRTWFQQLGKILEELFKNRFQSFCHEFLQFSFTFESNRIGIVILS